jgi:hypothetical protein
MTAKTLYKCISHCDKNGLHSITIISSLPWQQCSGGESERIGFGNNAAEMNLRKFALATMQRR